MNERIKELRNLLGLSQQEMADILGIKQNAYSNIETGKVSLTDKNKAILSISLGINSIWFDDIDAPIFLIKSPLSNLIGDDYGCITKKANKEDIRKATFETLDMRNNPQIYVRKDSTNDFCLEYDNINKGKSLTRPRVPLTAAAGSLSGESLGVTLEQCEQMPLIHQIPSYDFTMFIKGDSMSPRFESGDEIACRRIDQSRFIQWGKVHVLDTTQGFIIKRIYDDGDKIRCVSYNKDYADFSVPKEDIHSISLVVGSVSIMEM